MSTWRMRLWVVTLGLNKHRRDKGGRRGRGLGKIWEVGFFNMYKRVKGVIM